MNLALRQTHRIAAITNFICINAAGRGCTSPQFPIGSSLLNAYKFGYGYLLFTSQQQHVVWGRKVRCPTGILRKDSTAVKIVSVQKLTTHTFWNGWSTWVVGVCMITPVAVVAFFKEFQLPSTPALKMFYGKVMLLVFIFI